MKNNSIIESKADVIAMRLVAFVFVFMLSCTGMFGQTGEVPTSVEVETSVVSTVSETTSTMDLLIWINGGTSRSLEMQGSATEGVKQTTKKQLLQQGVTPNRILNQSLCNKAMRTIALA